MYLLSFIVFVMLCVLIAACFVKGSFRGGILTIISLVLCVAIMIYSVGGNLEAVVGFIDMPSILLIILMLVPMLLSAGVLKDLNNAFHLGAKRKAQADRPELMRAVEAVSFTIKALWTVGIFSVIFQFIIVIMKEAPEGEQAFLYTAVSLMPLCYTAFFVILLLPLRTRLKMQLMTAGEEAAITELISGESGRMQEDVSDKGEQ